MKQLTRASDTNDDKRGKTIKVAVELTLQLITLKKTPRGQMLGYLQSNKKSKIKFKLMVHTGYAAASLAGGLMSVLIPGRAFIRGSAVGRKPV